MSSFKFAGQGQMLDGRMLEASQVEYDPFGKPPLQREVSSLKNTMEDKILHCQFPGARQRPTCAPLILKCTTVSYTSNSLAQASETPPFSSFSNSENLQILRRTPAKHPRGRPAHHPAREAPAAPARHRSPAEPAPR